MSDILTTVVVPTFNSGHFLKWTLRSIADQTMENFECIVVDDCSSDGSISMAAQFFKDPRFKLIKHKMNVGLSGARNTGLRAARGRFVAFLDSDDLMMADSLATRTATCLWAERTSDRFCGSYCGSIQIEESLERAPESTEVNLPYVDFVSANGLCPFNANQPMIRTDVLRASGGFNHGLKQAEDFDLWQRLLRAGYWFAPAKRRAVTYRKRAGSMVRRQPLVHLRSSLSIINSTLYPLASDQLDWSTGRLTKPLAEYASQSRKIDRVLEFIGMSLASDVPEYNKIYLDLINQEIPDLVDLVNPAYKLHSLIDKGVRRQVGSQAADYKDKVLTLVKEIVADRASRKVFVPTESHAPSIYDDETKDYAWFSSQSSQIDLFFFPQSAYHLWTIHLLRDSLRDAGLSFAVIDISPQWRDGGVRAAAEKYNIPLIGLSPFLLANFAPRGLVVFNDWDPVLRPILLAAKYGGIQTIAIVEGIQDYDDADVHWRREAYKTADVVMLPGDFDKKYFEGHNATVVVSGIPRIEELRKKNARRESNATKVRVLINSNFSYGVLEEHRDSWLTEAVETVRELGMVPVISRHPADKGVLFGEFVSQESFYDVLETCEISIQRFASGILEALARNVGVIYYNPHGEMVDKFQLDPMNAYEIQTNKVALREALLRWKELRAKTKSNGQAFLDHHAGSPLGEPIPVCAQLLAENLGARPIASQMKKFRQAMEAIDERTSSLSIVRFGGDPLFNSVTNAISDLDKLIVHHNKSKQVQATLRVSKTMPSLASGASDTVSQSSEGARLASAPVPDMLRLTTQLLLDPVTNLPKVSDGGMWAAQVQTLVSAGGPAAEHFIKVRDWARGKVNGRKAG